MNIAVCDEESENVTSLTDMIKKYFYERDLFVNVYGFTEDKDLFYEIEDGLKFELIFLGVEKNSAVGIDTAYRLRMLNFRHGVILFSSTADFAIDGYEVGAVGYLPKPCKVLPFTNLMDRLAVNFRIDTYLIKHGKSIIRVPLSDIIYVESNNSKCTVHTSSGNNYTLYKHLSDIENELADKRFLRCHRSFIVNMNCVAAVDDDFILNSGERILIRQKSRKEIKNKFLEFASQRSNYTHN